MFVKETNRFMCERIAMEGFLCRAISKGLSKEVLYEPSPEHLQQQLKVTY